MTASRRRPTSGHAHDLAAEARWALLQHYGADREVEQALIALHGRHYTGRSWPHETWRLRQAALRDPETGGAFYPGGDEAAALVSDLAATVRRFGLDALGEDYAMDTLHGWCRMREEVGAGWTGAALIMSDGGRGGMRPESHRMVTVAWEADTGQTREDAERQAIEAVRTALDAIGADWEAAGYTFPDTAPMAGEHLRWLFLRLRHGWSWAAIAKDVGIADAASDYEDPTDTVRRAVTRLAERVGITLEAQSPGHLAVP